MKTFIFRILISLLAVFLFVTNISQAQQFKTTFKKPSLQHWMTPEEAKLKHLIGKDKDPTDPPDGPVTNIAEFDRMQSVLIAYSFGISYQLIAAMSQECNVTTIVASSSEQTYVTNQYTNQGVNIGNCDFIIAPSDSYWTRDYGPWFIFDGNDELGIMDFTYNRPRPGDNAIPSKVAQELGINLFEMDIETAGGNYMTNGMGISSSSDLIYEENPGYSHDQIKQIFEDYLGIEEYHVVPDPNNTYIDHIDCWGKFLDINKVLIRSVPTSHPQYDEIEATAAYYEAQNSSYGTPFEVYRVYTPNDQPYTNSLILNERVFVPITGSQWDDDAIASYEEAMPGYEILGFTGSWQSTDALHCRTKGVADMGLLHIRHVALTGDQPVQAEYEISAIIKTFSGQPVYNDSAIIYYRVNGSGWQMSNMTNTSGQTWSGTIPGAGSGSQIEYYIYVADESGRRETHPLIGEPDPHAFFVGEQAFAHISVYPDALNAAAPVGGSDIISFTITNIGEIALNFSIETNTAVYGQSQYIVPDSPSASSWDYNTFNELGWTELEITESGEIGGFEIDYTWQSDNWPEEGSFIVESPQGTIGIIAVGTPSGNYSVDLSDFNDEDMNGTWKIWIEDTYGDGGHQATNITVTITNIISEVSWLSVSPASGAVAPGNTETVITTCDASDLEQGIHEGALFITSNDPDYPVVEIPVLFIVSSYFSQMLELQAGWNMMSFRVQPENWNMLDIVQPLIDNDVLYKVMNETGGTIFHLPFPPPNGQWSNTIGDMANTEGYYIKVTNDTQLPLQGFVVETPFDIPLNEGWNLISYPCEQPQNALDALQPLIDQGLLYKVIDEAGGTIFHLPFPPPNGQWSNTIGNFESGEGYYVRVTGDAVLTLNESRYGSSLASPAKTRIETIYYQPVWNNNPYMPMHIMLQPDEALQPGDEIGVFDGDVCVGATTFDGDLNNPIIITTSMDDPDTQEIEGFSPNHPITIIIWPGEYQGLAKDLTVEYHSCDQRFNPLGSYVGQIIMQLTGLLSNESELSVRIIPNPAKHIVTVYLDDSVFTQGLINIFKIGGQLYHTCESQGKKTEIDVSNFPMGVYIVNVETDNGSYNLRLIKN
nr:agmatine deiminase family protein [Bacteroidota bacterium]